MMEQDSTERKQDSTEWKQDSTERNWQVFQETAYKIQILIVFALICMGSAGRVDFLGAVPHRDSGYSDLYFSCNVVGTFSQWRVDGNLVGAFTMNDQPGAVRKITNEDASALTKTVILLSVRSKDDSRASLDTIFILSTTGLSNLSGIICGSDVGNFGVENTNYEDTGQMHLPRQIQPQQNNLDNSVSIEYAFSKLNVISPPPNDLISGFMLCRVMGDLLSWRVNDTSVGVFVPADEVGSRIRVTSDDEHIATREAVLLARRQQPGLQNELTSVLIVSDAHIGEISVQCSTDATVLTYILNLQHTTTTTSVPPDSDLDYTSDVMKKIRDDDYQTAVVNMVNSSCGTSCTILVVFAHIFVATFSMVFP